MKEEALHTYLRDHLAGAAFGTELARTIEEDGGDDVQDTMADVAAQIEDDQQSLLAIVDAVGAKRNPLKEAGSWLGEKIGRAKFSGLTGEDELGVFMALEAMSLGIEGKRSLWVALRELADERLAEFDLQELIARAERQREAVEGLRRRHVALALT